LAVWAATPSATAGLGPGGGGPSDLEDFLGELLRRRSANTAATRFEARRAEPADLKLAYVDLDLVW
jgi:hypothetical protein